MHMIFLYIAKLWSGCFSKVKQVKKSTHCEISPYLMVPMLELFRIGELAVCVVTSVCLAGDDAVKEDYHRSRILLRG